MIKRNERSNKMRKFWITVLVIGVLSSVCWALRKTPKQAWTLHGLKGVRVNIYLDGAEYCGLTEKELQTIAESSLRRKGIKLLTARECGETLRKPRLNVHVTVVGKKNIDAIAATVYMELKQDVYLNKGLSGPYPAGTWQKQYTLINSVTALDAQAKEAVKDCLVDFCSDYLVVNPIEKPVPQKEKK
jgi:hypothetical protein